MGLDEIPRVHSILLHESFLAERNPSGCVHTFVLKIVLTHSHHMKGICFNPFHPKKPTYETSSSSTVHLPVNVMTQPSPLTATSHHIVSNFIKLSPRCPWMTSTASSVKKSSNLNSAMKHPSSSCSFDPLMIGG